MSILNVSTLRPEEPALPPHIAPGTAAVGALMPLRGIVIVWQRAGATAAAKTAAGTTQVDLRAAQVAALVARRQAAALGAVTGAVSKAAALAALMAGVAAAVGPEVACQAIAAQYGTVDASSSIYGGATCKVVAGAVSSW
jgi:hypothetical protein